MQFTATIGHMTRQIVFALDVRANGHLWLSREQVREKEAKEAKKKHVLSAGAQHTESCVLQDVRHNSTTVTVDLWG